MDRVCHFEIPFADQARVEKFYQEVFGWQTAPAPGEVPYTFAITTEMDEQGCPVQPGGINGGLYPRGEEVSSTPVLVIEVESCEQRVADVKAAGGSAVIGPFPVGDMGIYAQVRDSEDNIIGLWQPLPHS